MQWPGRALCLSVLPVAAVFGARPALTSTETAAVVASAVVPIDVDLDGTDELYCLEGSRHVIRDLSGAVRWRSDESLPAPTSGVAPLVADICDDPTPEALVAADSPDSTFIYWFNLRSRLRHSYILDRKDTLPRARERKFGPVAALVPADLDGDGSAELVAALSARKSGSEDQVSAIDCRAGTQLWSTSVGRGAWRLLADDVDGDGSVEVLVGTDAGVVCLAGNGAVSWTSPVTDSSSTVTFRFAVAHTRREGLAVPVVLERGGARDRLSVLSGSDGRLIAEALPPGRARLVHMLVDDLDFDDMPEVVTVDSRGGVEARDIGLEPVAATMLDDIADTAGVMTIPGRRGRQVFAVLDRVVTIMDSRLRTIGRIDFPERVLSVAPVSAGPRAAALLVRTAGEVPVFRVREFSPLARRFPWLPVAAGLVLLAAIAAAVAIYTNAFHAAAWRRLSRRVVENAGIAVLDRKGRLAPADGRARLLLADYAQGSRLDINRLLARPEFEPLRDPLQLVRSGAMRTARCEVMLLVERLPRAYRVTATASVFGACLLAFEDLSTVEYVRQIREWGPVAQRMAHGIKNPLTAMSLTLQRMERDCPPETREKIASLMEDVDRLRRMADGFMRFAKLEPPRLAREDLNAVIRNCIDRSGAYRPEGIAVEQVLSDKLPLVSLDRAQFCSVLDNLLGNAVAAMGEQGTLRVSTELHEPKRPTERRRAVVRIQDTGPGIPARYLERLFEPYFSLRPGGTGLGMCIAKRIVEDHHGSIAVDSTEGVGTVVTIAVPAEAQ